MMTGIDRLRRWQRATDIIDDPETSHRLTSWFAGRQRHRSGFLALSDDILRHGVEDSSRMNAIAHESLQHYSNTFVL